MFSKYIHIVHIHTGERQKSTHGDGEMKDEKG